MKPAPLTRRDFLQQAAAFAGAALFAPIARATGPARPRRTAIDRVVLGGTGLTLSRLGLGTGSNSGTVQAALGRASFETLVRYAYDQGITYFDCAQSYATFPWIGGAIKGLPRERLFLLSKVPGRPRDVLRTIDEHRRTFDTDYIDALLIHNMTRELWTEEWKPVMEAFDTAQQRGWIKAKGVSCHTLTALRAGVDSPWPEVHLVRVNPQGVHTDAPVVGHSDDEPGPVLLELRKLRAKNRGVIGMKIFGNGDFREASERERSIRFAMSLPELDAVVIGMKSRAEIDEAIERINRALLTS